MSTPDPMPGHASPRRGQRPVTSTVASLMATCAVLATSACGTSADSSGPPVNTGGAESSLTAPGATLEVGSAATITRDAPGEVLKVTITDVEAVDASTLPPVELASPVGGVFYVDYELEHVSGDSPYLPVNHFLSGWSGESLLSMVVLREPDAPCQEKTFPDNAPEGTVVAGCAVFVTTTGQEPLDRLQLSYGDDYDAFDGNQVTWQL